MQVKLYWVREEQDEVELTTVKAKNNFYISSAEKAEAKKKSLITAKYTEEDGSFKIPIKENQITTEDSIEIDIYIEKAPGQDEPPEVVEPVQFTVDVIRPKWKLTEEGRVANWDHCISQKYWCNLMEALGIWVICGQVAICEKEAKKPLPGATVKAFDADWIQDDELGQVQTDINGKFKIYYTRTDFEQTPISSIDIEMIGGPDVYFEVEYGGDLIIDEDQSDGRQPGRENVGHCFCAGVLCWDAPVPDPTEQPHWERIENLEVPVDFDTDGYAGSNKWVMNDTLDLHGNMPLRNPVTNNPLKYRFLIGAWDWPGGSEDPSTLPSVAPGNSELEPIPDSSVVNSKVGYIYYTDALGDTWSEPVFIDSSDLDLDGCVTLLGKSVTVDMHDGTTSTVTVNESNFIGSYRLLRFNTHYLTSPPHNHTEDLGRSFAGQAVDVGDQEPVRRYRVRFQVFDAGDTVNNTKNNKTLSAVVIDNSPVKHALQLKELTSDTCKKISDQVTILYTLDHPHMNSFNIKIKNNDGLVHDPTPSANSWSGNLFFRGGNSGSGGIVVNTKNDPPCAYTVMLNWNTRHYHGGRGSGQFEQILYCISERG
ncbi:MAG: hypothetical protein U5K69_19935 [Balneolaceae bacterium]|nr:hypothetical protein [Balneolaceae bacterium]